MSSYRRLRFLYLSDYYAAAVPSRYYLHILPSRQKVYCKPTDPRRAEGDPQAYTKWKIQIFLLRSLEFWGTGLRWWDWKALTSCDEHINEYSEQHSHVTHRNCTEWRNGRTILKNTSAGEILKHPSTLEPRHRCFSWSWIHAWNKEARSGSNPVFLHFLQARSSMLLSSITHPCMATLCIYCVCL